MLLHEGHGDLHGHTHEADKQAVAQSIWRQETVELTTAGIDIGSSTSHLLFAKIRLQRATQGLSSRFMVTSREVIYQSPIMLTPFLGDGSIDIQSLKNFIHESYHNAGFQRSDIDSGAVILTGEAIKRTNARKIADLFAEEAGKFVCATAGHKLECTLAAHGSGAVALSKNNDQCLLHVDIGGGTTKLALLNKGKILGVCAFAVGGRLMAKDEKGEWTRVDDSAHRVAEELGLKTDPLSLTDPQIRQQIVRRLVNVAVDFIRGSATDKLGMTLQLTEGLKRQVEPVALSFSGGVSEYLIHDEQHDYGDIAPMLVTELKQQLSENYNLPILDPGQGIRATVIGASQFTVQVSGKTIYLSGSDILPVHNVPVVQIAMDLSDVLDEKQIRLAIQDGMQRMDLSPDSLMAIAFTWQGDPEYSRLKTMGQSITSAVAPEGMRSEPLLLMIDGDIANILGNLLVRELDFPGSLLSVDGVQLQELDFVDIGELIDPPGVVPIVIKSLLFN
ncbi:MAG: ethanolamine ammonia-lyase reactivating factor EutA [Gammaproteobacteria bacterium]|jgi:ethanolamine utilization protein EutA